MISGEYGSEYYIKEDAMKTLYHLTIADVVPQILKVGLTPKIGKISERCKETQKRIYLFPTQEDFKNAADNWLIDSFEEAYGEGIKLCLLEVNVPDIFPITKGNVDYEVYSYENIPSEYIKVKQFI